MKTLYQLASCLLLISMFFLSCENVESPPEEIIPGTVQFGIGEPQDGTRGEAAGTEDLANARSIVLTIVDDQGTPVYDQEQLDLFNFSGNMVTEPISLNPGSYQLTEFLVLDDQGVVIYATPLEGSPFAHLVNDPLPIDFVVTSDQTTQVVPEVIDTEEFVPEDFGYASFRFVLAEHFNFLIAAFAYDEATQGPELTTADLTVSDQATGNVLYSTTLGDTTNVIAIRDGFDYKLLIEKDGYTDAEVDLTNAELKAHGTNPLEVFLMETGLLASNSFVDSGVAFSTEGSDVASGDLDGDGDVDLFITVSNGQPNEVWLNDGAGNFANSGQTLGSSSSHFAALADLDNDGDLDAFVANYGNQSNRVYLNDGTGTFTDSGQALGNSPSLYVVLGDLDGDGDFDAIVGNDASVNNTIWFNDGSANFTKSVENLGSTAAYALDLGDVDADGDLDLFVASINEANQMWINDGSGSFSNTGQSLGNERSAAIKLADVDGDGDLDAFVGNNVFNSGFMPSKVLINDGNGNFTDSGQSLGNSNVQSLILVDFDLDGDLDALTVSYYSEPYKLWTNDGNGSFTDSGQSFGNHFATGVVNADFDGDGDQDFFVTVSGSSHKLWLGEQN